MTNNKDQNSLTIVSPQSMVQSGSEASNPHPDDLADKTMERRGIPTVKILTEPFLEVARSVALSEGFGDACFVPVPAPLGMLSASAIRQKAEKAFEAIFSAATTWQPPQKVAKKQAPYPAGKILVNLGYPFFSKVTNFF